jgi:hypothetical protein
MAAWQFVDNHVILVILPVTNPTRALNQTLLGAFALEDMSKFAAFASSRSRLGQPRVRVDHDI